MKIPFDKGEARSWARENMHGVANVVTPTFTSDLSGLNEEATRHDIRLEIEYGFYGTLLVSEVAVTLEEYAEFVASSADEAQGELLLIHHASFNSLEDNIAAAKLTQTRGATLALLGYPPTFYPTSADDIFNYTKAFCDTTDLGVILFPVPLWGFERIHPSAGFSPDLIDRLLKACPNIVAIKAEGGMPTVGGFVDVYNRFADQVIVIEPIEGNGLPLATLLDLQFMGTSNYEYYGPTIPKIFKLIRGGKNIQAMDEYWKVFPARQATVAAMAVLAGSNFLHRMLWKYQGWLQGFNGGPLRAPSMRLVDRQMKALRQGLIASGYELNAPDDAEFFVGRNPA
ncbi:MAG TPA: dihydrodipicolinate synthase family protein [Gammaproteobacteria bacterium]|nr:dihydrodipicolinate synthase family protein [Gammaproteobacteria bacterium]